jgi:outer membrane protein TolC
MRQALPAICVVLPLLAQEPLSLQRAVQLALEKHPAVEASRSRTESAESRVALAGSALLPRVTYSESWARSDNPVFAFSSLLTQHQFTEANFQITPLNRPDFLNNFQSQVTVDQTVYDWGATRSNVRAAELGRAVSKEQEQQTRLNLMARVVRAYYGAVLAQASLEAAREGLRSAEADLRRAETIRKAGMSTDADLLSIQVHVAAVREQEIRRSYDAQVAMAALNESLGMPLGAQHVLTTPLMPGRLLEQDAKGYQSAAAENRPELKQAALAAQMAEYQIRAAKAALLPQVGVRGAFEANRQEFVRKGGANWLVAASLRWNLFDGMGTRARIAEAQSNLRTARASQREANQGVQLQVFQALASARSAEERLHVAAAVVAQAEESLRITKNRYESGLSTVTDLLRNEVALLDARTRRLAAMHDQRVAIAELEVAAGTLSTDSEIFK